MVTLCKLSLTVLTTFKSSLRASSSSALPQNLHNFLTEIARNPAVNPWFHRPWTYKFSMLFLIFQKIAIGISFSLDFSFK